MRYAAYLSFENTPASYGPFRQAGFRCAVLTVLSSSLIRCRPRWGELDVAGCYACLYCQCLGYCSIVLARREHCPRDPRQFVCCCHDQYVSWRPRLKRGHPGNWLQELSTCAWALCGGSPTKLPIAVCSVRISRLAFAASKV